jgi:hypothetical protein
MAGSWTSWWTGPSFYDAEDNPAGQVITLRDVTARKRAEQINRALFRIASALYRFPRLDRMLEYITRQVQDLDPGCRGHGHPDR